MRKALFVPVASLCLAAPSFAAADSSRMTSVSGDYVEARWSGTSLGTQWSQGEKRSSFIGSFELR